MAGITFYTDELIDSYQKPKFPKSHSIFSKIHSLKNEDFESHTNRVNKAFRTFRITLSLMGRWPFYPKSKPIAKSQTAAWNNSESNEITNQIEVYDTSLKSPLWVYFSITTVYLVGVLSFSMLGFCDFFLEWNLFSRGSTEPAFESNLIPFVLVWSCLLHSSVSSVSLLINRKKVVKFLNYWNVAVDMLEIEIPKGIQMFVVINHLVYLIFLLVVYIAYKIMYLNLVRGGAALMGILTFRPFVSGLDSRSDFYKVRVFGLVTIIYAIYASRVFLLIYSFKVKLLKHGFKIWNGKFKEFLLEPRTNIKDEQQTCEKLFQEYRILLKLIRLTDSVFGSVLQSYYGSQLLNMCFELYYLARSGTSQEETMNVVAALIVLTQNFYIFFSVSLDAAYVAEEATKGLDILRSHGINPDDSIHRKYLISNMQLVFSQRIVLTGGKFFSVDRPFIVTVLGAVFTYFIIVLQVGPELHRKFEE